MGMNESRRGFGGQSTMIYIKMYKNIQNYINYFIRSLLFESPPRKLRIALFLQAGRQPPLLHKIKNNLQHYLKLGKHLIFYISDDLAEKTSNINLYQG